MKDIVDDAVKRMKATADLTPEQEEALRDIVIKAVIAASESTSETAVKVAKSHEKASPKAAPAISADIENRIVALIANLQGMR